MIEKAFSLIAFHEGYAPLSYRCTMGKLSWGYGWNLEANLPTEAEILEIQSITGREGDFTTPEKAASYLDTCKEMHKKMIAIYMAKRFISDVICQEETKLGYWPDLDDNRAVALVDMGFQMGIGTLLTFTQMHRAMVKGDYPFAAKCALDSQWAVQTPSRANRVTLMIESGEWPKDVRLV